MVCEFDGVDALMLLVNAFVSAGHAQYSSDPGGFGHWCIDLF
jgi:hypothetical protein